MATNKISDLAQDKDNLNTGSEAGAELLDRSLEEVGYARSMVMSSDGVIICGNQTHKASMRRGDGDKRPIVVETDGDVPVIVKRKDVKAGTPKALKIAAYDNLANQRGLRWSPETRQIVEEHGLSIEDIGWTQEELTVRDPAPSPAVGEEESERGMSSGGEGPTSVGESYQVVVECRDEQHQQEMYDRLTKEGLRCRVLTL